LVDGPVLSGAVVSKRVLLEFGQRSAAVRRDRVPFSREAGPAD
jgi:hypothetical protein